MLMRLDRKMVNIMDHENKEVVERFPIHLVREPTAFTSSDPKVRIPIRFKQTRTKMTEEVFNIIPFQNIFDRMNFRFVRQHNCRSK